MSEVQTFDIPAGTTITPQGVILGSVDLSATSSYVVTAAVTAVAPDNDSLQCQMLRPNAGGWDDMAEYNLSQRITTPLEHAYPSTSFFPSTTRIMVGCVSKSSTYTVETGHIYAWRVGSIYSAGSGPRIQAQSQGLEWRSTDPAVEMVRIATSGGPPQVPILTILRGGPRQGREARSSAGARRRPV